MKIKVSLMLDEKESALPDDQKPSFSVAGVSLTHDKASQVFDVGTDGKSLTPQPEPVDSEEAKA